MKYFSYIGGFSYIFHDNPPVGEDNPRAFYTLFLLLPQKINLSKKLKSKMFKS